MMSFKYRLILFYVFIEIFFISLIVLVNFTALKKASENLTNKKIDSNIVLISELLKVPLSIYDVATLDNLVEKILTDKDIDSLVIFDSQNNYISGKNKSTNIFLFNIDHFKKNSVMFYDNVVHIIKYQEIYEDDILLGSFGILFGLEQNDEFIIENRNKTLILILLEILISVFISYYVGNKLTNMLSILSSKAKEIGEDKNPEIPYLELNDEIGTLAKSINKMNDDLKIRNENIIEMNKQKDNFFANMSHELKTPLNSINIISSIMLQNKSNNLSTSELKNVEIINKCGQDLLALINDILDISKLEAGQIRLNCIDFDLNELIENIIKMFESESLSKNITLIYRNNTNIKNILNDDMKIKQIIVNLLSNAFKFSENGKIELIINDLGDNLEFIVKDTGIGIPENKLQTIFERFKQVDDGISRKYGGTGLGLAICNELAKLLYGKISAESELHKGSKFKVIIQKNIFEDYNLYEVKQKDYSTFDLTHINHTINNLEDSTVLFANKNILAFMNFVIELKRRVNFLNQLNDVGHISKFKNSSYDILILNYETFFPEEISTIVEEIDYEKLIIFVEDLDVLDIKMKEKANLVLQLPLTKEDLIEQISNV